MGTGQSKNRITAQDRAILDMKVQRDKLRQYQKRVQAVLDREDQLARELLQRGDRRRALLALRRRKYQEQMIHTTDQQLSNLEQLMGTIEFSLLQKDVLFGLEQGSRVLTQLNKEMRIEDVERLAEETADAIAYQEEVSEVLRTHMSAEDEEAVERELELLECQEADRLRLSMPHAPQHALPEQSGVGVGTGMAQDADTDADEDEAERLRRNEPLLA
ncbi:Vacuolar protein sorting-associated protein 20 [Coemansia biformis]|uniref:Vacuolar protein sorting-associated protein 20 n=1 Tax=Coemansia biformis TaxID=1286918 RepID=A0A9W7YC51_9FUNG|nr:Vacuolar protein sorting-associated protein 20 [Coemansia biformis]